ncbi:MAG: Hsp20/alpha crystallin family protein [Saprospiraceae bacterium]|nr:Hsp20/alpha crystallin family protein [Saprospiraceae bacterium]
MCHFDNARHAGFQHRGFGRFSRQFNPWASNIPVNVREKKDWYEIFVYAPGLSKDAFQVSLNGDALSIRFNPSDATGKEQWLHQEYVQAPFERQFLLHGKVDTSGITARYQEGVLELTLPKLPGSEGVDISVA